jgi:hypothetical protein
MDRIGGAPDGGRRRTLSNRNGGGQKRHFSHVMANARKVDFGEEWSGSAKAP